MHIKEKKKQNLSPNAVYEQENFKYKHKKI